MNKKELSPPKPKNDKAAPKDLPELEPIMVSRQEIPKLFPGLKAQTLANLASKGQGPKYYRKGKLSWYVVSEVRAWLTTNPVQTSEDFESGAIA